MTRNKKIVLLYKNSASIPNQIIQNMQEKTPHGFELAICDMDTPAAKRRAWLKEAQYIVAYSVPFEDFDVIDSVKFVQLLSAGADMIDLAIFNDMNIPVANNGSVNAWTVAEHAMLLMLSLLKKLPTHHNSMQDGIWLGHQHALELRELRDKQVGIIGFGHIGQTVARMVGGFDAKVAYYDPFKAKPEVEKRLNAQWMELDELLKTSDIMTIHMPLLEQTRNLLSDNEFKLMKPSALLINTARGAIINQTALINALDQNLIAGAGLDTFETEPLTGDNPFIGRSNVILTPHIAGTSIDNWTRRINFCFDNILRVQNGEAPNALLNK